MAYDAASGTVVLFGGFNRKGPLGDTWTWNGATWTKQVAAAYPPARDEAAIAYDAATGTVVLFGGFGRLGPLGDTWTWNGASWSKQVPVTRPPVLGRPSMAYDATASRTAVLFGGINSKGACTSGTWTWDGSTWTRQAPATSPPAREAAHRWPTTRPPGTAVLFGGAGSHGLLGDTWTWDGSTSPAGPGDQPARPATGANGLRRGRWHRSPVRRRQRCKHRHFHQ